MDDAKFLTNIKAKISQKAGRDVDVHLGLNMNDFDLVMDMEPPVPVIVLPLIVLHPGYSGVARMAVEYAVGSLRAGRLLDGWEFTMLLRRN